MLDDFGDFILGQNWYIKSEIYLIFSGLSFWFISDCIPFYRSYRQNIFLTKHFNSKRKVNKGAKKLCGYYFVQYGFIQVYISFLLFWKTNSLSFYAFCVFYLFCVKFDAIFINFVTFVWSLHRKHQELCLFILNL